MVLNNTRNGFEEEVPNMKRFQKTDIWMTGWADRCRTSILKFERVMHSQSSDFVC